MTAVTLVVKKNDGTTDVNYLAVKSASGEQSPAIWLGPYLSGVGNSPAHVAQLRILDKTLPGGKVRQVRATYLGPMVSGAAAPYTVGTPVRATVIVELPLDAPDQARYEAISQCFNCLNAVNVKDGFKSGYAP